MTALDWLDRMTEFVFWADDRVLEVLERAPDEAFAPARRFLHHVLASERIWLLRLGGRDTRGEEVWPLLTDSEARSMAAENRAGFRRYLHALDESDLANVLEYTNQSGRRFRTAVADVLTHVAVHGAYHRGQVARAIREAGGEPVNTDFITYVRELPEPSVPSDHPASST